MNIDLENSGFNMDYLGKHLHERVDKFSALPNLTNKNNKPQLADLADAERYIQQRMFGKHMQ